MSLQNSKQISDVKVLLKIGADGVGIDSIEKTGTSGIVDTYTITYTDGRKTTFEITNGNGIVNIEKTATSGLADTYTITFEDGTTYDYTVINGRDGGMSALFNITADVGASVTVTTPSGQTIVPTLKGGSTTEWYCNTVEYGTHTVTSTAGGSSSSSTVNVDICKVYSVNVEFFTADITVTFPSDATCTCVGGGESYTASVSPATFTVHSANTYTLTVSNGSITRTETVSITTSGQTESITIDLIPDGSTVTPTNDIQTWLHCGGIFNKSYTTLSEVLADTSTLSTLVGDSNAVDYMARSTTWASGTCADSNAMTYIGLDDYCADSLLAVSDWRTAICNSTYFESVLTVSIPTMTSNTTPSGEASSKYGNPSFPPYYAFNGNNNNGANWIESTSTTWNYISYRFPTQIKPYKAYIYNKYHGSGSIQVPSGHFEYRTGTNKTDAVQKASVNYLSDGSNTVILDGTPHDWFSFSADGLDQYSSVWYWRCNKIQVYGRPVS